MTKKGDTVAIIQARMGSTRLPGKVMRYIEGEPMLKRIFNRTKVAPALDKTVIATSEKKSDDKIEEFCRDESAPFFRGSEKDVLDRFYRAAKEVSAGIIVRINADCPLVSPEIIDRVVRIFNETNSDYTSNTLLYTYPLGLNVEVFSFEALEETWRQAETPEEREHVTSYMKKSDKFDISNVTNNVSIEEYSFYDEEKILRWTVDYSEDLEFIRRVYRKLFEKGEWTINQISVLELLERNPELLEINEDMDRKDLEKLT